ncbi:hypothetical protein BaRGS_00012439 [Batillaria attramentaria]|uniref:Uncharacterized protein n=1 Tax=Batillaria attramentaria TaxID=370345 RepID=A0ABD0L9N4_9CAEN
MTDIRGTRRPAPAKPRIWCWSDTQSNQARQRGLKVWRQCPYGETDREGVKGESQISPREQTFDPASDI